MLLLLTVPFCNSSWNFTWLGRHDDSLEVVGIDEGFVLESEEREQFLKVS